MTWARGRSTVAVGCLASILATGAAAAPSCRERRMRVTFYTCARGDTTCVTKLGDRAIPLRTVAVGDPVLLGRWLYVAELGGLVRANDTGPALGRGSMDVFLGDARMRRRARALGVRHWTVQECRPASEPSVGARRFILLGLSGAPAALARRAAQAEASRYGESGAILDIFDGRR